MHCMRSDPCRSDEDPDGVGMSSGGPGARHVPNANGTSVPNAFLHRRTRTGTPAAARDAATIDPSVSRAFFRRWHGSSSGQRRNVQAAAAATPKERSTPMAEKNATRQRQRRSRARGLAGPRTRHLPPAPAPSRRRASGCLGGVGMATPPPPPSARLHARTLATRDGGPADWAGGERRRTEHATRADMEGWSGDLLLATLLWSTGACPFVWEPFAF